MILVYSRVEGDYLPELVRRAAESHFDVDVIGSVALSPDIAETAWCFLITTADWAVLPAQQRAQVLLPRICVTQRGDVGESSGRNNAEAHVRITRLDRDLKGEIVRLRVRWLRSYLRMRAEERIELPILTRRAIDVALRAQPPIRTVSELADRLACSRSALWKAWHGSHAPRARLEDLLDWVLLIESIWLKASGLSMTAISDHLRVHQHTIVRNATRLSARSHSELAAFPHFALSMAIVRERVQWLLGEPKSTNC